MPVPTIFSVIFVPLFLVGPAQGVAEVKVLKLEEGAQSPPAKIADVAFIAGHWQGEALGGKTEEIWSPPQAGSLMGVFRLITDDKVAFYEILTITEEANSLVLRIKHFHPDLKGWEEKDEVRVFPLVRVEPRTAYFDGLTFRRDDDGRLTVWVRMKQEGKTVDQAFPFRAAASPRR
jgi:hypothetical protein